VTALFLLVKAVFAAWLGGAVGCAVALFACLRDVCVPREERVAAAFYFTGFCAIWPAVVYYRLRECWLERA
jgi:hypothetical protein